MNQKTGELSDNTYVPWLDSALLPEESTFSVINKVAWFLAMPPIQFFRACKSRDGEKPSRHPVRHEFSGSRSHCAHYLNNERLCPIVLGKPLKAYLQDIGRVDIAKLTAGWEAAFLRVCPACIAMGVHLRIHQHQAVVRCPIHEVALQSTCDHCQKPLEGELTHNQPAFSCPHCKTSLLGEKQVVTYHTREFRKSVSDSIKKFEAWAVASLQDQLIHCGAHRLVMEDRELHPISHQHVHLAAGVRAVEPPSWILHPPFEGVDIGFKTLDLNQGWSKALTRGIPGNVPEMVKKLAWEKPLNTSTAEAVDSNHYFVSEHRFRAALTRVTSVFLSRYAHLHPQCLNVPHQMVGRTVPWYDTPSDLLLSCPVALGFWMWRGASDDAYRELVTEERHYIFKRVRQANIDLLLYAIARSHLHYCLYVAMHCIDKAFAPGSCTVREAVEPMDRCLTSSLWTPMYCHGTSTERFHFDLAGKVHYVHFDISGLIPTIPCAGSQVLKDRTWRRLIPMHELRDEPPLLSLGERPSVLQIDEGKTATDKSPPPFTAPPYDYLFMPVVGDDEIHVAYMKSQKFPDMFQRRRKREVIVKHCVLDTSISSKHRSTVRQTKPKPRPP